MRLFDYKRHLDQDLLLLSMPNCPKCHQIVDAGAIACPHCREVLKAYGHPGIPLYRAGKGEFLCDRCLYDADDTCTFTKRPHAKECTLFSDRFKQNESVTQSNFGGLVWVQSLRLWCQRYQAGLVLLGLATISFLVVLIKTSK